MIETNHTQYVFFSLYIRSFGPIFLDFSPHYVMYSGWVGDNDPTFDGLQHALKSYLQSAWASMLSTIPKVYVRSLYMYIFEVQLHLYHSNALMSKKSFQTMPTLVLILGATEVDLAHLVEQKNSSFVGLNLVPSPLSWKMEETKSIGHGSLILTMRPLIYTDSKSLYLYLWGMHYNCHHIMNDIMLIHFL